VDSTPGERLKVTVSQAKGRDVLGIKGLLIEVGLPIEGVDEALENFRGVREGGKGKIIACGGLEVYDDMFAIMRSVAVAESFRGKGIGVRVVKNLLSLARRLRIFAVVLLTENAAEFFEQFGFEEIPREAVGPSFPESLSRSWVWSHHPCDNAVVMVRDRI